MNFIPTRASALEKLNYFIENGLKDYSKARNFDYGPDKRDNTSCLSPYISHGAINEIEVIKKSLNKFSFSKNEKFIQEVLWRTYWKGWLELRPNVWTDFLVELNSIKNKYKDNENYLNAIEGNTNIECFNYWVKELKNTNYLHNHTRMWFASIWIFTLDLPWQLGAEFFLKHLLDGDPASNTLGWRWVAGIQTQGKHYLASEWNIKKFTNNRFNQIKLNENATPKISEKTYTIIKQNFTNPSIDEQKTLVIFDNNLSFESSNFTDTQFKKIILIKQNNENREIKLSENVVKFKEHLNEDQKKRLEQKNIECQILDINDLKNIDEDFYILYPSIGESLDFLIKLNLKNYKFLYRGLDSFSWQFCNKGFFNFKNHIPKIVSKFT
ncbi:FAD-binding domain-containing protein [Candidatus Pelagibacter sp.]|uniref:FAD-binding domain-containing protein n=1 Tax=Candidatus Pelagibacter sp. TaxID=2024849 RepID=UPI003F85E571